MTCLAFASPGGWGRDPTYKDEQVFTAKPDSASEIKALVMIPDKPVALAILFPGRTGALNLTGSTAMVTMDFHLGKDFSIRSRNSFFKRGVAVIGMDSINGKDMTSWDRVSSTDGVRAMLDLVRKEAQLPSSLPVWAIGSGAGTISAAALAIRLPNLIDGIVLASSVTRPTATVVSASQYVVAMAEAFQDWKEQNGQGVASMAVGEFDKPVMVLSDKDDRCPFSSPMDAEMLTSKFVNSPRREVKIMSGGNPNGDACSNFSPHGFYGIEDETVDAIVRFMKLGK